MIPVIPTPIGVNKKDLNFTLGQTDLHIITQNLRIFICATRHFLPNFKIEEAFYLKLSSKIAVMYPELKSILEWHTNNRSNPFQIQRHYKKMGLIES
jgi:hypothetical protein